MGSTTPLGQEKIMPLLGYPCVTLILSQSHVKPQYQLSVPAKMRLLLPAAPVAVPVVVIHGDKSWDMVYHGDRVFKKLDGNWKTFAIENNLKAGDALVFELMDSKKLAFRVQILKGNIPVDVGKPGGNSTTPIVID